MAFMIATPHGSSDTWHTVGYRPCSQRQSSCYIVVVRSIDSFFITCGGSAESLGNGMYLALDEPPLDGRSLEYIICAVGEVKASGALPHHPHHLPPAITSPQ